MFIADRSPHTENGDIPRRDRDIKQIIQCIKMAATSL